MQTSSPANCSKTQSFLTASDSTRRPSSKSVQQVLFRLSSTAALFCTHMYFSGRGTAESSQAGKMFCRYHGLFEHYSGYTVLRWHERDVQNGVLQKGKNCPRMTIKKRSSLQKWTQHRNFTGFEETKTLLFTKSGRIATLLLSLQESLTDQSVPFCYFVVFFSQVGIHPVICQVMYIMKVCCLSISLLWNLLVGIVLLSVCRTHTIGKLTTTRLFFERKAFELQQNVYPSTHHR